MNEQQNTALIQKLYDAFARGDIQTILDNLTADVEWEMEGPASIPYAGKRKGPEQVRGFFEALGSVRDAKLIIEFIMGQNDKVASLGRFTGTVIETGKSFNLPIGHFFTVTNGKVSRFVDFTDTAATAEAHSKSSAAAR